MDQPNKGWEGVIRETAPSPKQQFHILKDAADHALIMDAIELICTNKRINAICIVSSDGGFSPFFYDRGQYYNKGLIDGLEWKTKRFRLI
ncbi:NYN domain-containing protein [Photobacterium damselae]|uniref:NYN domain-containing protein n=1 Tax=Photobacterium damselae TaxID=38293 RepID=UPI0040680D3B